MVIAPAVDVGRARMTTDSVAWCECVRRPGGEETGVTDPVEELHTRRAELAARSDELTRAATELRRRLAYGPAVPEDEAAGWLTAAGWLDERALERNHELTAAQRELNDLLQDRRSRGGRTPSTEPVTVRRQPGPDHETRYTITTVAGPMVVDVAEVLLGEVRGAVERAVARWQEDLDDDRLEAALQRAVRQTGARVVWS